MAIKIKLTEIPFFQFVTPGIVKSISKFFKVINKEPGEEILLYGQKVPGLYILVNGKVDIYTENFKIQLATFEAGSSFGEMALIEDQTASASIRVGDEAARLIFCDRELFRELLAKDFVFAAAFYKGSSLLLSQRLRFMNQRIETEIETGKSLIQGLMEASDLSTKLGFTRNAVNETGMNMFDKLSEQLSTLQRLEKELPQHAKSIKEVRSAIESVLTIDTQNFDLISQQIDQVKQYLHNIQRLVASQELVAVEGDKNVFSIIADSSTVGKEGTVTFF